MSETRDGQRYYDTGDTNIEWNEHNDCERQLNEAEDKIIKLEAENAKLKDLVKIKNEFLVCYRICRTPSEKLWARYEKVKLIDQALKENKDG